MVNNTPNVPPAAQINIVCQNGKSCQYPIINKPGKTKITEESVPAEDACVCTMLFSRILESLKNLSTAIEMTAAGIDDANVIPTFRPRYTLDAVKITVINAPRMIPRKVNSFKFSLCICYILK